MISLKNIYIMETKENLISVNRHLNLVILKEIEL